MHNQQRQNESPSMSLYASSAPASSGFMNYQPSFYQAIQQQQQQRQQGQFYNPALHHTLSQPLNTMNAYQAPVKHQHPPLQFSHYIPLKHQQQHQQQQQAQQLYLQHDQRQQHSHQPVYHPPPPTAPGKPADSISPVLPPLHTMDPKFLDKYTPNAVCLGSGGFGFVSVAVRKLDNIEVAVKFILREKVPPKAWARDPVLGVVPTEVYILKNINHVNVIKYLDYFSDKVYLYLVTELHGGAWGSNTSPSSLTATSASGQSSSDGKNRSNVKMLSPTVSLASTTSTLDSCETLVGSRSDSIKSRGASDGQPPLGPRSSSLNTIDRTSAAQNGTPKMAATPLERRNSCDLFECIEFYQRLNEDQARRVFKQIVDAVSHLASHNIIHRDIKDENILIDRDFNVKLIDFGSATFLTPQGDVVDGLFLGTLQYAAPEILTGKPYRGMDCEVWSLGCCLYIMLAGEAPFENPGDSTRLNGPLAPRNVQLSHNVSGLIRSMLEKDPCKRATLRDIASHPWVLGGF
ncbi:hypothetical protein HDU81_006327 [Chytriomyces hyalinus]|nr:hypothetical protein HDU81_006327 [Chytriomyces hyalinus]